VGRFVAHDAQRGVANGWRRRLTGHLDRHRPALAERRVDRRRDGEAEELCLAQQRVGDL
jgi:hypothetical protein